MSGFLKHNGDVRNLRVYKMAECISVITEIFVVRFLTPKSRTVDQMQQAARSCKQNIVEGSQAATTSKETEIKLTNVARASLGELEDDYRDFLNFRNLPVWGKTYPRTLRLREYLRNPNFENQYRELCQQLPAEEFCNMAITLIRQTQYMLDRLMATQQDRFQAEGGIREAMTRARLQARGNQSNRNYQNYRYSPKDLYNSENSDNSEKSDNPNTKP